jgi:hypothetical protein
LRGADGFNRVAGDLGEEEDWLRDVAKSCDWWIFRCAQVFFTQSLLRPSGIERPVLADIVDLVAALFRAPPFSE